jgi:hypothetical protein
MEIAVVAGLGLIGSYIANNDKNDEQNPITEPGYYSKKKNSNISENNMHTRIQNKVNIIESNEYRADLYPDNSYSNSNNVKLFPTENDSRVHHLYDTRMVPKLNDKFYGMASTQREKSKIPERTNIIPPFFNQPYQNHLMSQSDALSMGPVPTSELLISSNKHNETFESQFNLQSVDNIGEPASMGDSWNSTHRSNILNLERNLAQSQGFSPFDTETVDMTYNIVPPEHFTHNNMQAFTSKRDLGTSESNNFEYKMEIFSGSSKNWNPKRETVPFFDPEEYKQTPFKQDLVVDQERDRIVVARVKQGERPFEPVKVAPGLNLNYDELPQTGRHDTFRVMPKDTNELRPTNKPKLTFEGRIQGAPKKGEKRGITAPVIKRRPEQWRYQTVDDFVPNKAQNTGPTPQGNYVIPDNARMNTTCELKGPAQAPTQVGPKNRAGDVKISKRVKHVEDKLGPKGTDQFNLNDKSYNLGLTERNTANFNEHMPAKNTTQGGQAFDPNDLAKNTHRQTIEKFNPVGPNATNKGHKFDDSDIANTTKKQQLTSKQLNTNAGPNSKQVHAFNESDIANTTKKQQLTSKQLNTNAGPNSKQVHAFNESDIANTTKKQQLTSKQLNTNAGPNSKQVHAFNESDIANTTKKQQLTSKQLNTNAGPNSKQTHAFNESDIANTTKKQQLTSKQLNTNAGPNSKQVHAFDESDITRTTGRQTISDKQFNTMVAQLVGAYSNLTDHAKITLKQILATQSYQQIMSSAQHNVYSNLSDEAKTTLRQILSMAEFNTNAGPNSKQVHSYNENDVANTTLRQILSVLENNTMIGSAQKNPYANTTDDVKTTLKQTLTEAEFNTHAGPANRQAHKFDPNDITRTTLRQTLSEAEFNTVIGQLISSYANLTDESKTTIRQILSESEFNTNLGPNSKQVIANLSDQARTTLKQILSMEQFNTNLGPNSKQTYANLSDVTKTTLREILSVLENNTNMGSAQKNPYANLSDQAKTTLKQVLSTKQFNTTLGAGQKNPTANLTDIAKTTVRELLTTMELQTNMSAAQKEVYSNLTDLAKTTIRETLTESEFNTFLAKSIGSYSNLPDEAKTTIRQLLSTQQLDTMIGAAQKSSYANLSDNAKTTLKQLLTLQTFSNHIRQNIGTYANISDQAKQTIKELLTLVETNTHAKSAQQGTYTNLMDLAKSTIKEFIAIQELNSNVGSAQSNPKTYFTDLAKSTHKQDIDAQQLNNNVGTVKREIAVDPNDLARHTLKQDIAIQELNQNFNAGTKRETAFDPNDLAKTTHKQDLIHANYSGPMNNSSKGTQQVSFDIAPTQKDLNKAIDYVSAPVVTGGSKYPKSQKDARNMRQNIVKEVVAQGRNPTLSGPKLIPTRDNYDSMTQRTKPNFNRIGNQSLTTKTNTDDRLMFRTQHVKEKATYDERLYQELLSQFEENPLINNPQTTSGAKFKSKLNQN